MLYLFCNVLINFLDVTRFFICFTLNFDQQQFIDPYSINSGLLDSHESLESSFRFRFKEKNSFEIGFQAEPFEAWELERLNKTIVGRFCVAIFAQNVQSQILESDIQFSRF